MDPLTLRVRIQTHTAHTPKRSSTCFFIPLPFPPNLTSIKANTGNVELVPPQHDGESLVLRKLSDRMVSSDEECHKR